MRAANTVVGMQAVCGAEGESAVQVPLVASARLGRRKAGDERACPAQGLSPARVLCSRQDLVQLVRHDRLPCRQETIQPRHTSGGPLPHRDRVPGISEVERASLRSGIQGLDIEVDQASNSRDVCMRLVPRKFSPSAGTRTCCGVLFTRRRMRLRVSGLSFLVFAKRTARSLT
jgi:hypothetical protein